MEKIKQIIEGLNAVNAQDILVYDFEKTSPFYDYFIIATTNERSANAAVMHLKKIPHIEIKNVEGKNGDWILIDAADVIIHLFKKEERQFYNFEQRLLGIKQVKL